MCRAHERRGPLSVAGVRAVYEFRVDTEVFHVRVAEGTVEAVNGPAQFPDATLEAGEDVFIALAEGTTTLAEAIRNKTVRVSGDREALRRLRTIFLRPDTASRQVAS